LDLVEAAKTFVQIVWKSSKVEQGKNLWDKKHYTAYQVLSYETRRLHKQAAHYLFTSLKTRLQKLEKDKS
jgi:hypothetical protein